VPGLITSGQRQNIAVISEIDDGGPDGSANTISGNTLFAEEGVFAP